ncbi:MAG TPA: hypothetical protein VGN86_04565 [Pyrinomonadaceae bacterium]|nr:hypothetical protein [Pyrinomonadaceae bacterium]
MILIQGVSFPAIPAVLLVTLIVSPDANPTKDQLWQVSCNRRKLMDVSYVTAVAALGGAALGGFTSFATSWTTLRIQMKTNQSANSKSRREKLYKAFIDQASRIYGDALIHSTLELSGLIGLYSLISRMRILSSEEVIENASRVAQIITETFHQPNKTPDELQSMIHQHRVDLLQEFSNACRKEFESNHLSI